MTQGISFINKDKAKIMTDKNEKYAIFIDIDGTLITDSFTPPEENIRTIERARKKGHKVFINTGRSYGNMPDELKRYAMTLDGLVSGSGSYILLDGKVIHSVCFPDELLEDFCRFFLEDKSRTCLFEGVDDMFALGSGYASFGTYNNIITGMDDYNRMLKGQRISVIALKGVSEEECRLRFGNRITLFWLRSYFDCVLNGCDKANGIDIMLSALGLPLERTIAIGDSTNDLPMIKHCAVGVAMGNATDELKNAADYVTGTNSEFGVATAIETLLF